MIGKAGSVAERRRNEDVEKKRREGSAETQVPLPELPKPEVEVEGLLSEKKRQMIWTVVALAEQEAYREDWGNEELDEYLQTPSTTSIAEPTSEPTDSSTESTA